ncbi:DUF3613 domain-containing protein [Ralstonia flaminis]|jgi:hypothetical protein|uniref:Uncharacterized protein n=1 Tax=Ralstonia flaminis TaxID=3058597 RepID=A0ABM9KAM1_9RALS|nr:DUF3613 domain-containing protein [Ralstonia sp. LMG 18101]CAJ0822110.1 hypothetical protein LMG18101_04855 [Ralstonia sp. LMG 18101]
MINRILMVAGMATWLACGIAAAQGFSGADAQSAALAAPKVGTNVNDATRALLRAQRDGTYAGEFVPLRGEQAALAYQRYLNSFNQPMPSVAAQNTGTRTSTQNTAQSSGR